MRRGCHNIIKIMCPDLEIIVRHHRSAIRLFISFCLRGDNKNTGRSLRTEVKKKKSATDYIIIIIFMQHTRRQMFSVVCSRQF